MQSEAPEAGLPLQRGCPRCGAPVPSANLELHLLRCQPAGVVGSVFGAASGEQWPCSTCTFLNAEEQRCCAMCGGVRDAAGAEAQSPARGAAVLGSVFTGATDEAEAVREGRETDDAGREMLASLMARSGLQEVEQEAARGPEARAVAAANRMQQARTASSGSYALDTTLSRSITWSSPLSRSISWPSPPLIRCGRRWLRRGVSVRC